jgi:zinc transport system ATP-binding protein
MKNIVNLQHVFFSYGEVPVLEDVTIAVEERDFLAVIGPNGGGKSTILKIILGLLEPSSGTVTVFGGHPKNTRRSIGYLPQLLASHPDFPISVIEVVLTGRLGKRGIGRRYTEADVQASIEALRKVGMEQLKDRNVGSLSGGERQRVFIARALATEPRMLLLDEPVSSVDTEWQATLYDLLHELNRQMAIVLVTHDISVVSTYIDKIACVSGKLYYHGSKKEGLHKIAEMYECPVQLLAHESSQKRGDHTETQSHKD